MSTVNDCVAAFDCARPVLHREAVIASMALAATSPPAVEDPVATHPVRGSGPGPSTGALAIPYTFIS
jgi:hypothetical protein